jgi:hypothetical protein
LGALNLTTTTKRVPSGASGGATQRITGTITEDITRRVVGVITASTTVRVPVDVIGLGPFLLLEGDFAGALAMEGDESGYLRLQGAF